MAQQKLLKDCFTVNGHLMGWVGNVQNDFDSQMNDMYILHHFKRNKKKYIILKINCVYVFIIFFSFSSLSVSGEMGTHSHI